MMFAVYFDRCKYVVWCALPTLCSLWACQPKRHRVKGLPAVHNVNWESISIDLVDKLFTLGTGRMLLFRKFTHSCQALRRCTLTIDYNLFVLQVLICVGGE